MWNHTSQPRRSISIDWMPEETTMDNFIIWLSVSACGSCFISKAAIVQQNGSRRFHIQSSSSLWFLVPRSSPVEWVIVKVHVSNQDSPDWVTAQQLHTAVPSSQPWHLWLPTAHTVSVSFVHLRPLCLYFHSGATVINQGEKFVANCNRTLPGILHKKLSGVVSGLIHFQVPALVVAQEVRLSCQSYRKRLFCSPSAAGLRQRHRTNMTVRRPLDKPAGEFFLCFFGKPRGWCWCQCVDMRFSQWLSAPQWIDATGRPAVTTETAGLSANISVWKFDELICVSHIVPLISVTRTVALRTSGSSFARIDIWW